MKRFRWCLLWLSCSWLLVAVPAQARPHDAAEVRREMTRAFKSKDYASALRAARRLYEMTKQPIVLLNIARCHDLLKQNAEAIVFYRRYLRRKPQSTLSPQARERLEALIALYSRSHREVRLLTTPPGASVTLDDGLTLTTPFTKWLPLGVQRFSIKQSGYKPRRVTVTLTPGRLLSLSYALQRTSVPTGLLGIRCHVKDAKVFAGATLLGLTPLLRHRLPVGKHTMRVEAPGYRSWTTAVTVVANKLTVLEVTLQPTVQRHGKRMSATRIAAWTTLSVGIAALAGGLTAQLLARKRSYDANRFFDDTPTAQQDLAFQQRYSAIRHDAETRQKIAIGLFATGGALVTTAIILFVLKRKRRPERLSWTISPTINGFSGTVRF